MIIMIVSIFKCQVPYQGLKKPKVLKILFSRFHLSCYERSNMIGIFPFRHNSWPLWEGKLFLLILIFKLNVLSQDPELCNGTAQCSKVLTALINNLQFKFTEWTSCQVPFWQTCSSFCFSDVHVSKMKLCVTVLLSTVWEK